MFYCTPHNRLNQNPQPAQDLVDVEHGMYQSTSTHTHRQRKAGCQSCLSYFAIEETVPLVCTSTTRIMLKRVDGGAPFHGLFFDARRQPTPRDSRFPDGHMSVECQNVTAGLLHIFTYTIHTIQRLLGSKTRGGTLPRPAPTYHAHIFPFHMCVFSLCECTQVEQNGAPYSSAS